MDTYILTQAKEWLENNTELVYEVDYKAKELLVVCKYNNIKLALSDDEVYYRAELNKEIT